ncbi:MAG: hypothetical protein ACT4PZ_06385 [Panacagrimonas sp.]
MAQRLLKLSRTPEHQGAAVIDPAVLPDQPDTKVHVVGLNSSQRRGFFFWDFRAGDSVVSRILELMSSTSQLFFRPINIRSLGR